MKVLFITFSILIQSFINLAFCQIKEASSLKKISRGYIFGYGRTKFNINENSWNQTTYKDSLNSVNSKGSSGFSLGFLLKINLSQYLSFRPKAQLSFEETNLIYNKKVNGTEKIKIEQLFLDLPLHFTIQSCKGKNMPYALLGPTIRFALGSDDPEDKLHLKKFDVSTDLGIGIELKQKQFVIAPEFIFSKGLMNMKGSINNLYNNVLDTYRKRSFYVVLNLRSL
jgi:hypothetical protein